MDYRKRDSENKKRLPSKRSICTVIEISKKINELLEQMEYKNNELLLTKEHIKQNLIELINYADYQQIIKADKIKKSTATQNLRLISSFSHNYYIDNRGRLITNYSI